MEDPYIGECYDVLAGKKREISILNKGSVILVDCSPRLCPKGRTCEYAAVRAARVSYGLGLKTPKEDTNLLNYLIRNYHTSPLEMITLNFRIKIPIFVARQFMRHRTFAFNEYSMRYSEAVNDFYIPDNLYTQCSNNKQGSSTEKIDESCFSEETLINKINLANQQNFTIYKELLGCGVSREIARGVLPTNIYTEMYCSVNLNNFFKFLNLRMDSHAQWEIQELARAMHTLAKEILPDAMNAYDNYIYNSITLTQKEVESIKLGKKEISASVGENREFLQKLTNLGV
jgi:thymidylate synthase (FAD)